MNLCWHPIHEEKQWHRDRSQEILNFGHVHLGKAAPRSSKLWKKLQAHPVGGNCEVLQQKPALTVFILVFVIRHSTNELSYLQYPAVHLHACFHRHDLLGWSPSYKREADQSLCYCRYCRVRSDEVILFSMLHSPFYQALLHP
ncbi:hypothetical protein RB195_026042 [Necator americanus]|uniref:Uncharacterized protein n=1 Tax=Necator americanus TaxID=51031 RepID=A0ABR1EVI7_NECAM